MTTYWTRCDTLLPPLFKRVLVFHKLKREVNVSNLSDETMTRSTGEFCWEDDNGFLTELCLKDMWCDIPYPESTEVCVYDNKEVYDNCTVEIWSNENNMSIGWWKNERDN